MTDPKANCWCSAWLRGVSMARSTAHSARRNKGTQAAKEHFERARWYLSMLRRDMASQQYLESVND